MQLCLRVANQSVCLISSLIKKNIVGRIYCFPICKSTMSTEAASSNNLVSTTRKRHSDKAKAPKVKKAAKKTPDMSTMAYLQVVQNGSRGHFPSLLLRTTNKVYMFNAPEGVQRMWSENPFRLMSLENIFFTQNTWQHSGGLCALALTMQSGLPERSQTAAGEPIAIKLHGPAHVNRLLNAVKPFMDERLRLSVSSEGYSGGFSDESIDVFCIPLSVASDQKQIDEQRTELQYPFDMDFDSIKHQRFTDNLKKMRSNFADWIAADSVYDSRRLSVAYVCRLKPGYRKIDVVRCAKIGIKIGPQMGKLQRGESVTLPDGRVVTPEQVTDEPARPASFAVVDCPREEFVAPLLESDLLAKHRECSIDLVVHLSAQSVIDSEAYRSWMQSFGPETSHLILNENVADLPHLYGLYHHQLILHKFVHEKIYPELGMHRHQSKDLTPLPTGKGWTVAAEPLLKYHLKPHSGLERGAREFCHNLVEKSAHDSCEFDTSERLRAEMKKIAVETKPYPEIVFLGTASASCSKYRNNSGILLHVDPNLTCLLDCGEGTLGQLRAFYGPERVDEVLRKINLVFVSHMHADHHLGLFSIAIQRKLAFERAGEEYRPFYLIAPLPLFLMHNLYCSTVEDLSSFAIPITTRERDYELIEAVGRRLGLGLRLVQVFHRQMPNAIVIECNEGRHKIVYSGDTRPCENLVKAGKDADLLIHEATFAEDMSKDAVSKMHSTTEEAVTIGRQMNASCTVLTHFSNRYNKVAKISDFFDAKVAIANDFMRFTLADRAVLPLLTHIQKAIYIDEHTEIERVSEKRRFTELMDGETKIGIA